MSLGIDRQVMVELKHELRALRGNWFLFVIVGVLLIVLGFVALSSVAIASLAATVAIGTLLLLCGVVEIAGATQCRGWSGFFLELLSGLLSIVIGILFLRAPASALVTLTLLIAAAFLVGGLFKIITAIGYRYALWGWALASGAIDVVLGILIWQELPGSAFWVIGLYVGITMVFRGVHWLALGMALRSMPSELPRPTPGHAV